MTPASLQAAARAPLGVRQLWRSRTLPPAPSECRWDSLTDSRVLEGVHVFRPAIDFTPADLNRYVIGAQVQDRYYFDHGRPDAFSLAGTPHATTLSAAYVWHDSPADARAYARQKGWNLTTMDLYQVRLEYAERLVIEYAEPVRLVRRDAAVWTRLSAPRKIAAARHAYLTDAEWSILARDPDPDVREVVATYLPAHHPDLRRVQHDPKCRVRLNLSSRRDLPSDVILTLARDPHPGVRTEVARGGSLPDAALESMALDAHPAVARAARHRFVARTTRTPQELELHLHAPATDVRATLAQHPAATTAQLLHLLNDPATPVSVTAAAALHARGALPDSTPAALMSSPHWQVRVAALKCTGGQYTSTRPPLIRLTPELIEASLLCEPEGRTLVIMALARHPDAPNHPQHILPLIRDYVGLDAHTENWLQQNDDVWQTAAASDDPVWFRRALQHANTPERTVLTRAVDDAAQTADESALLKLARHASPAVRYTLSGRLHLPPPLIKQLLQDDSPTVLLQLANNPALPDEQRQVAFKRAVAMHPHDWWIYTADFQHFTAQDECRLMQAPLPALLAFSASRRTWLDCTWLDLTSAPDLAFRLFERFRFTRKGRAAFLEGARLHDDVWLTLRHDRFRQVRQLAIRLMPAELVDHHTILSSGGAPEICALLSRWDVAEFPDPGEDVWAHLLASRTRQVRHLAIQHAPVELLRPEDIVRTWCATDLKALGWKIDLTQELLDAMSSRYEQQVGEGSDTALITVDGVCPSCGHAGQTVMFAIPQGHGQSRSYVALGDDDLAHQNAQTIVHTYQRLEEGGWGTHCPSCRRHLTPDWAAFYWPGPHLRVYWLRRSGAPVGDVLESPIIRCIPGTSHGASPVPWSSGISTDLW